MYRLATVHSVADRRTDVNSRYTAWQYDRLIKYCDPYCYCYCLTVHFISEIRRKTIYMTASTCRWQEGETAEETSSADGWF